MNLKGRIERLETHHVSGKDDVTLGELVEASYWAKDDPRFAKLNERCSRSRLGRMLAEGVDRGCRSDALIGGPPGESRESGGGGNV